MTDHLLQLTDADLRELASALKSERLTEPFTAVSVGRIVSSPLAVEIASEMQQLAGQGFGPSHLAVALEMAVHARSQRNVAGDSIDLVVSGPEAPGAMNRDTSVVVRELFAHAETSVLVAGYAVFQGQRVFQALAERMEQLPALQVRLFLDVQRGPGDSSTAKEITRRFAERFRTKQWPKAQRFPEVYFDPRSLATESEKRACLHAKCIVVDRRASFVSSANFTEAAQERNLEVGLLVRDSGLAESLQRHFDALVDARMLERLL